MSTVAQSSESAARAACGDNELSREGLLEPKQSQAQDTHNDQVDRDDVVQETRHHQDEDARDQLDDGGDGDVDVHYHRPQEDFGALAARQVPPVLTAEPFSDQRLPHRSDHTLPQVFSACPARTRRPIGSPTLIQCSAPAGVLA